MAAAGGDLDAFTSLVRRHESAVRAFVARTAGRDRADDIAQETFVKAWRKAGAYSGTGSYRAWLFGIAWNQFLSAQRRQRPEDPLDDRDMPAPSSEDARIDAARALASLEPRERAAAQLCFGYGHSHAEAAGILGLPLGTLKSVVARARTKLVAYLGETE